ncbi:MAG: ABC transporter ATP-binding protein/permease [Desulfobacteraceae bacterium]|nr:ABC transporter ATP-binding protein/permease [Desulfobacteraceae bacterium]
MSPETELEEKEIKLTDFKLIKGIWPFIKPFFWMLCVSVSLVFLLTFLELLSPILIKKAIDGFILPVSDTKQVMFFGFLINSFKLFGIVFLGIITLAFIIDFIQAMFMEYTGQKIILNLRERLFEHMVYLPVSFYDQNTSGRLVSRVAGDVENMNEMFTNILVFIFKDIVFMISILSIMFYINFKLALYLFILVPLIFLSIFFFSKISRNVFRTLRQKISEINHSFSESITGIAILQTTSSTDIFLKRFKKLNFEHFKAGLLQIRIFAIFMPFVGFLGTLSVGIIIYVGGNEVGDGKITIGILVAFLTYMKMFFRPVRELSEKFNLLQNALASGERIISILNTETFKTSNSKNQTQLYDIKKVEFQNISFAYNKGEEVLKDISFAVTKGRSLGIVGQTGSGKTSIINLLSGFYQQDSGRILINNNNYDKYSIENIRDKTALVMQDPILFSGSIRENITPSYLKDDVVLKKALKDANCDFLFNSHPGLDTMIFEQGKPLSSGEKQLVCIARAFAFNPDLIIFDEATSYLDSESEQKVHKAMKKLMKGRLSIIIAHRLSTVRNCDNLIFIKNGTIRESGSHEELVKLKGEYYHLLKKESRLVTD